MRCVVRKGEGGGGGGVERERSLRVGMFVSFKSISQPLYKTGKMRGEKSQNCSVNQRTTTTPTVLMKNNHHHPYTDNTTTITISRDKPYLHIENQTSLKTRMPRGGEIGC
jgi:hypothetical protein